MDCGVIDQEIWRIFITNQIKHLMGNHFESAFDHTTLYLLITGNVLCVFVFTKKKMDLKPSFSNILKCLSLFDILFLVGCKLNSLIHMKNFKHYSFEKVILVPRKTKSLGSVWQLQLPKLFQSNPFDNILWEITYLSFFAHFLTKFIH